MHSYVSVPDNCFLTSSTVKPSTNLCVVHKTRFFVSPHGLGSPPPPRICIFSPLHLVFATIKELVNNMSPSTWMSHAGAFSSIISFYCYCCCLCLNGTYLYPGFPLTRRRPHAAPPAILVRIAAKPSWHQELFLGLIYAKDMSELLGSRRSDKSPTKELQLIDISVARTCSPPGQAVSSR